jgi:hypothetical protein
MKPLIFLLIVSIFAACGEPLQVTGKTDQQATTSGTLGSVKANNQMPERTIDTPAGARVDTTLRRRN